MKRLTGILTAVLTAAVLTGCGNSAASASAAPSQSSTPETAEAAQETTAAAESTGSHVLVLYYSGTGHTKNIADMITADTGADEYEITPSVPYTEDDLNYSNADSRVSQEHEDESLQDVAFDSYDVPDWDSYNVVFIGYPIWWQDASWVMKSYVKHLDFSGKTVIPFCTSIASGLGDSGKNLEALAGSGNWLEGQRFSGSASEDDVQEWIDGLNL